MPPSPSLTIGRPRLDRHAEWLRVCFPVGGGPAAGESGSDRDFPGEVWFDIQGTDEQAVSEGCDAALSALLMSAMEVGHDIVVEGPVSASLLWSIRNTVQPMVLQTRPFLHEIRVEAAETVRRGRPGPWVMSPLSCGIDSFSAIQEHALAPELPPGHRITHLVYGHFGHHGYGPETDDRAEARWETVSLAAEELGLPILRVRSNQHLFYSPVHNHRLNWLATLTPRNASIPLLLQGKVGRFLMASGHSWREITLGTYKDITRLDPMLLPALSTHRVDMAAVGTEMTRVEKTRRLAGLEVVQRHLDVCIMDGGGNCTSCEKCLRTLLTLDLLGFRDAFAGRFKMDRYERNRSEFVSRVWLDYRSDHCHLEIRELMDEIGFRPGYGERARVAALRAWRLVPHAWRKRLRG